MRPKYSVPFLKSPLGAFIAYSVLIGCSITSVAAQTRLGPSQVAPLKGDVRGPFSSTALRDMNSAADHGNGLSNSITSAISDCGIVSPCSILIPAYYGTGEQVPGYRLNTSVLSPATTPGNISIFDRRYGEARMFVNNDGYPSGLINAPSAWVYDYYAKAAQNAVKASMYLRQWSLDGGNNQQSSALGYSDKTTWATILNNEISHTPAQHLNTAFQTQSTSLGDTMGFKNSVSCYGGYNAQGDVGCRAMDNFIAQGTVEYSGTLSGSPHSGATSVSVAATQGATTQGAGRFLAKTNAGTISSGAISGISNPFGAAPVVTGSGTAWPLSTLIAHLGTDVNSPGVAVVTPSGFAVGSLSALSTSSMVCVSDSESFEMVYPTAVAATNLTLNLAKIHPSTAVISSGGVCGYLLDITADDVTNTTYPAKSQTITGTLHFPWPLIASTSPTSASVWVTGDGGFQSLTSRWSATNNGYVMYPFAEVVSVQQAGAVSDTLTLGPNSVPWTAGDSVSEFLYSSFHLTFGNTYVESYYPNISSSDGFSLRYNQPLQGFEAMLSMANNAPASMYRSGGGRYDPPYGIQLSGRLSKAITIDSPGDSGAFAVGCASPCNAVGSIVAASNGVYYDFLTYDQAAKHWNISANNNATHYSWAANQFGTPFSNTYITADANGNGYVATQQIRSNLTLNSDLSGELAFANSSTATFALQGTYATHPECLARPEFDLGSANRFWVSYGATSVTVTFSSPVTGVVSLSCVGRK